METRNRRDAELEKRQCLLFAPTRHKQVDLFNFNMHVKEEDILLPRKSSISNPDDWPTFNIKRIRVTSQKTGQEVSLLSANTANPVRVSGRLDKIDDDLLYLGNLH